MRRLVTTTLIAGCAYRPGSFTDFSGPFPHTRTTVGCVDIGVGFGRTDHGAVVAYELGNRCDRSVVLDLATVRVVGRDADGRERPLSPFDPRDEIHPVPLPARWWGGEQIAYNDTETTPLVTVCVDVGGIDASQPRAERWVCP
jgi:hypothetical protein